MNKKLVQQLREGKIAVKNDGTLEELKSVLKEAFPFDKHSSNKFFYFEKEKDGNFYYFRDETNHEVWDVREYPGTYTYVSTREFFKEEWIPKRGERVLVKYDEWEEWSERIYLATIEGSHYPYLVVHYNNENAYCRGGQV